MKTAIVSSEEEMLKAVDLAEKEGLKVACVSNAALPQGYARITFLPKSAFTDEPSSESPK